MDELSLITLAAAKSYTDEHGGGGGGTSNYNDLSNKPQIGGVTLSGNKSASDLGLVAAVDGKGLSTNDYTDADKAIVGGVTAALAGKQGALTAGKYIDIDANNEISVDREIPDEAFIYTIQQIGDGIVTITKTVNGAVVFEETYNGDVNVTLDALQYVYNSGVQSYTLLIASDTHEAGFKQVMSWWQRVTYTENFSTVDHSGEKLIIKSEMDTALAGKQNTLTFDDVPTDNSNNPVKSNGIYDALATKQNATDNSLDTTAKTIVGAINEHEGDISSLKSGLTNQTTRSRSNITSRLTNLTTAVAEQNLEKYGYKIGDYFTGASGYTYHLADMDTFYGSYNNNAIVNTHHISLVVKTGANSKWAETNDTSGGYKTSTLHSFLSSTVLDNIKSDMIALFGGSTGLEHLVSHKLLWTTATSGAWAWSDNAEYISALSEPQVYGTNVWAIDGYQTGEAWKWLEIFHKFNFCEIIGNIWWWLRSISAASRACNAVSAGGANDNGVSVSGVAVGLIIFH